MFLVVDLVFFKKKLTMLTQKQFDWLTPFTSYARDVGLHLGNSKEFDCPRFAPTLKI